MSVSLLHRYYATGRAGLAAAPVVVVRVVGLLRPLAHRGFEFLSQSKLSLPLLAL
jgi:hypothetical protein